MKRRKICSIHISSHFQNKLSFIFLFLTSLAPTHIFMTYSGTIDQFALIRFRVTSNRKEGSGMALLKNWIRINWDIYSESSKKYEIEIFFNISNYKKKLDIIKTSSFHHIHNFMILYQIKLRKINIIELWYQKLRRISWFSSFILTYIYIFRRRVPWTKM